MTLIDRYVFREWLAMLVLVLVALMGLLLMQAMYDDFRDLLDVGAGVIDVMFYFAVKMPSYLSVVLPLALLVSLLYVLGRLHRNLEITALRAAGVGLFRVTRTIWLAGVGLCALTWYLNSVVIPWSVEESRGVWQGLLFQSEVREEQAVDRVGSTATVAFDNRQDGRMWFMNRYSAYTGRGYGVAVTELDELRREKTRLQAREAWFDAAKGGWVFKDGRETWIDPATGAVQRTTAFERKVVTHYQEDPALMLVFDLKPDDLSFHELRRIIDFYRQENDPKLTRYAVRYYSAMADTLGPLIIIALAIPFSVSGVRVNPAVGVSKSIGLVLLYLVLAKFSAALGTQGTLQPVEAAIAPGAIMLLIGLGLMQRVR